MGDCVIFAHGPEGVHQVSDGNTQGNGVLAVRYAMLFYVLKRLGLLGDAAKQSAHTQHIVTINRKETEAALEKAEFQL